MHPGDCIDAIVYTGLLSPLKQYFVSLNAADGVGFYSRCVVQRTGFINLLHHRSYRLTFPVVACDNWDGRGSITAKVHEHLGGIVSTTSLDVVMPPAPYDYFGTNMGGGCIIDNHHGTKEAGGRTADGLAHYGSSTILSGITQPTLLVGIFGGQAPSALCYVGMTESVSSRYTGEAMTVTTTLRKTGQTPRTSTVTGSCSTLDNHRYPCRRITPFLYVSYVSVPSVYNFLFGVPSDRLYLSGTHEISSGLDTITLDTSSRYNVPVED